MELKGSKTERNLMHAFAGESEARNKYTYYASQAKKEGFVHLSKIFEETANNEKEHAKIWFKWLHDGEMPQTVQNLEEAIASEHHEWTEMYKQFAQDAKEEGFEHLAGLFELVAGIEKEHEERFKKLLENIRLNQVFNRQGKVVWECANCGYSFESENAVDLCPVCKHPKSFFFIKANNY